MPYIEKSPGLRGSLMVKGFDCLLREVYIEGLTVTMLCYVNGFAQPKSLHQN